MKSYIFLCWLVHILSTVILTESARILAIPSVPSYSHQVSYRKLWTALSKRGHEVILITTDPLNDHSLTNLTEIDVRINYELLKSLNFVEQRYLQNTWINLEQLNLWQIREKVTENILNHPQVRKLYEAGSGEKFDLILNELIMTPILDAFAYRFNAPLIGITSLGLNSYEQYVLGAPILPSHPSSWEMEETTGFNLSLWQRIKNFLRLWHHVYLAYNKFMPHQQIIAEKYFGKDIPDLTEIEANMSLMLLNQQDVLSFARPQSPNIIKYGNFHILKELSPLSRDLKKFLDVTPNGFIYVSFGTNVLVSMFSKNMLDMFLDVFANLPCKVVWKCDIELSNKPDNIYIAKWFPQQSILAHPKIRLFIYQGGLQSTEEAVHYAVPLIGLPVFADQISLVSRMVSLNIAKSYDLITITKEKLNGVIIEMLNDKGYKKRMVEIKTINDDQPYDYLENAIWWIEFVIRHKGAPQLRNTVSNYPWYQRYDTDVIATLSIASFVALLSVVAMLYKILQIFNRNFKMANASKKKVN